MKTLDQQITIKPASVGTVSHGTLRTEDLLEKFASELEWQIRRNGEYFSRPENFGERDKLNNLVGQAQGQRTDDGTELLDEEIAVELVGELQDALQVFCPSYFYFGAHCGDGSDFGFWPEDVETIKDQVGFVSSKSQDYPEDGFTGEWLHVSDHGNCTLYVRDESGNDTEIWGIV